MLAASKGHVTGDEVLLKVQDRHPSTNKTTVYRTLELLSDLGFVAVTDLGVAAWSMNYWGGHTITLCARSADRALR